jgi:NTP pyrophosphatase (non-canonical NTP hydrolase)
MKTLNELQPLIVQWAKEKDLIKLDNAPKQRLKLIEEVGETARAILKNDVKEIKDGLGDIFVVLIILAEQVESVLNTEFDTIKNINSTDSILLSIFDHGFSNISIIYTVQLLNDLCVNLGYDLTECANLAWNEIKDRTGKNVNGTFIKDEAKP